MYISFLITFQLKSRNVEELECKQRLGGQSQYVTYVTAAYLIKSFPSGMWLHISSMCVALWFAKTYRRQHCVNSMCHLSYFVLVTHRMISFLITFQLAWKREHKTAGMQSELWTECKQNVNGMQGGQCWGLSERQSGISHKMEKNQKHRSHLDPTLPCVSINLFRRETSLQEITGLIVKCF